MAITKHLLMAAVFAMTSAIGTASAHKGHSHSDDKIESKEVVDSLEIERARRYFSDTILLNHRGEEVKFYSDMLNGKTVVISFIFTECEDACPMINAVLNRVQTRLGARMGEDIYFVSISVDPEKDTPQVLADYRAKFHAGPAWDFLTGDDQSVDYVGSKMGQVFERESHLTALLVGNTKTAHWRKVPASLPENVLTEQILQIADGQTPAQ